MATAAGEHASPWRDARPGAHVARAAMYMLHAQVENGTQCPLTMTFAAVPALRGHASDALASAWLPKLLALDYDPRPLPVGEKRAALIGMGMTERQGGSDVRSNRTRAEAQRRRHVPAHRAQVVLLGAAMRCASRARAERRRRAASSCRGSWTTARATAMRLVRLKDKLGNRSNASSEVEFDGAVGFALGEPGRGIATILEMVRHTRLDCVLGTAGMMRGGLAWAIHHASHRIVFGRAARSSSR